MDKAEAYDCWEGVVNGCLEDKDLDDILSILDYPFHGEWDCLGPILPDMLAADTGPPLLPLSAADANATHEPLCQYPKDTTSCPLTNKFTDARNEVVIFNSQSPVSVLQANNNAPSSVIISKRTRSKRARPSGPNPWLSMLPPSFAAAKRARRARRDESLDHVEPLHNRIRKCVHCEVTKTPQWREGPMGPKTLCNACGVRYRSGRLFPEYRPAASPTFIPSMHSNSHRKVIEMRDKARQAGEIVGPAPMSPDMEFVPTSKYLLKHLGQRKNRWVCFS